MTTYDDILNNSETFKDETLEAAIEFFGDEETAKEEINKMNAACVLVYCKQTNEALIFDRNMENNYAILGGHKNPNEPLFMTALRELYEECGISRFDVSTKPVFFGKAGDTDAYTPCYIALVDSVDDFDVQPQVNTETGIVEGKPFWGRPSLLLRTSNKYHEYNKDLLIYLVKIGILPPEVFYEG